MCWQHHCRPLILKKTAIIGGPAAHFLTSITQPILDGKSQNQDGWIRIYVLYRRVKGIVQIYNSFFRNKDFVKCGTRRLLTIWRAVFGKVVQTSNLDYSANS